MEIIQKKKRWKVCRVMWRVRGMGNVGRRKKNNGEFSQSRKV